MGITYISLFQGTKYFRVNKNIKFYKFQIETLYFVTKLSIFLEIWQSLTLQLLLLGHLHYLNLVLFPVCLILGYNHQICVGELKDVLDGVVQHSFHADSSEWQNCGNTFAQESFQIPKFDNASTGT